ncbi:MAG: transcription termination factor Rho, partial [Clostridia bacterium]|nr:transcription termination factor Rho [Clostridia bacterium]
RMDDVIFEEFKGTGNMEVVLDRSLSEKRVFPAIDINKSGTRREDLLLSKKELNAIYNIRKSLNNLNTIDITEKLISQLMKTKNNNELIDIISKNS